MGDTTVPTEKVYRGEQLLSQSLIEKLLPIFIGTHLLPAPGAGDATPEVLRRFHEVTADMTVYVQDSLGTCAEHAEQFWLIPESCGYQFLSEAAAALTPLYDDDDLVRRAEFADALNAVCDKYCLSGPPYWVNEDALAAEPDADDDEIADLVARVDTLEHTVSELAGIVAEIQNRKICTCP